MEASNKRQSTNIAHNIQHGTHHLGAFGLGDGQKEGGAAAREEGYDLFALRGSTVGVGEGVDGFVEDL